MDNIFHRCIFEPCLSPFQLKITVPFGISQTLSLEAGSDEHLAESRVLTTEAGRLLRSAAIYGPNASGKSNLIEAMVTMRGFVLSSAREGQVGAVIPVDPFRLRQDTAKAPSLFEWEFLLDGYRYRYGFQANAQAIQAEWLMRKGKGKEATLFTRELQEITPNPEFFREGLERKQFARPNTLFLSLCAQLNGKVADKILTWFQRLRFVSGLSDRGHFFFTARWLKDATHRSALAEFAQRADFNICGLDSELVEASEETMPKSMPDGVRKRAIANKDVVSAEIRTQHPLFDNANKQVGTVELDLEKDESDGTQKFIALSGPLHHTVEDGATLVIDEFEARLHPLLTQAIFEWFHSPRNTSRAQLIVATHDVQLMDPEFLRRDQVWFCEKDEQGATDLYSLAEFDPQKVRHTTKFGRQYLLGLFGGIPKLALLKEDAPDAS